MKAESLSGICHNIQGEKIVASVGHIPDPNSLTSQLTSQIGSRSAPLDTSVYTHPLLVPPSELSNSD